MPGANITKVWPLDVALARGIEMPYDKHTLVFTPLTVDDWGGILRMARSEALEAYLKVADKLQPLPNVRAMDVHAILFTMTVQHMMTMLRSPPIRRFALKRSLHTTEGVTDALINKLLDDELRANMASDIVELLSIGPQDPATFTKEDPAQSDPTDTEAPSSSEKSSVT
jgi:hypothetical protein